MSEPTRFRFGEFELDLRLLELRRAGEPIAVQAKAFALLAYLVRNADRVVSQEELLREIWSGVHVDEGAVKTAIRVARRALGDSAQQPRWIENARGRGYRFCGPLESLEPAGAATAVGEAAPARASEFVGRESQLRELYAALEGEPRVLLLHGSPGIGKTRTSLELAREAAARGFEVHVGRTIDGQGAPPFWPWIEILRSWFDVRSPDERAKATHAFPHLRLLVPERLTHGADAPALARRDDAQRARFALFDEFARFLRAASLHRPLLLVLDDLHWADDDSLELLFFLARQPVGMQGLILGTHREAMEPGPSRGLAAVLREHGVESMGLRGLPRESIERILREKVGPVLTAVLGERICEATGGNPLFVLELARSLADDASTRLHAQQPIPIPERVRDVIGSRIGECSAPCQSALRALCVDAAGLEPAVLRRALSLEGSALIAALGEAERASYVVRRGDRYEFAHGVVRETLYDALEPHERASLHLAVGEAIEAVGGPDAQQILGQVSYHFAEAQTLAPAAQRALDYAQRAAEAALGVYAYADAAALYRRALRALDFVERPSPELRCSLQIALGEMLSECGGSLQELQEVFLQAMELARAHGFLQLWARAAVRCIVFMNLREALGPLLVEEPALAVERLQDALEAVLPKLDATLDAALRARVLMALHALRAHTGEPRAARALVDEALRISETTPEAGLQGEALIWKWSMGVLFEDSEERRSYLAVLLHHVQQVSHPFFDVHTRVAQLYFALERGDRDAAEGACKQLEPLAAYMMIARLWLRTCTLLLRQIDGDLEGVQRENERTRRAAEQDGWRTDAIDATHMLHAWWTRLLLGGVEPFLEPSRQYYRMRSLPPILRLYHARLCAHCGLVDEARAELDDLERKLAILPRDDDWLFYAALAGDVCGLTRDLSRAGWIYDTLAPYAQRAFVGGMLIYLGSVSRPLGLLAALLGRWDESEEFFAAALDHTQKLRSPVLTAVTELDHAAALLERGRPSDLRRAQDRIRSAVALAERRSFGGLLERARSLSERSALR